jgi:hypothetical protein
MINVNQKLSKTWKVLKTFQVYAERLSSENPRLSTAVFGETCQPEAFNASTPGGVTQGIQYNTNL